MSDNIETLRRICPTCEACCGLIMQVDRDQKKNRVHKGRP